MLLVGVVSQLSASLFIRVVSHVKDCEMWHDAFQREQYKSNVSVYAPEISVLVDETGTDRRNTLPKYGYNIRGRSAINLF